GDSLSEQLPPSGVRGARRRPRRLCSLFGRRAHRGGRDAEPPLRRRRAVASRVVLESGRRLPAPLPLPERRGSRAMMLGSLALSALPRGGGGTPGGIKWERSFDEALKKARASQKPIFVDFWAEWCFWCHQLEKTTYADPAVVGRAEDFVAVKVNTEGGKKEEQVALRYDVQN